MFLTLSHLQLSTVHWVTPELSDYFLRLQGLLIRLLHSIQVAGTTLQRVYMGGPKRSYQESTTTMSKDFHNSHPDTPRVPTVWIPYRRNREDATLGEGLMLRFALQPRCIGQKGSSRGSHVDKFLSLSLVTGKLRLSKHWSVEVS